ncbi:50S ribosomal protein L17 [Candidatus Gottesmanbacteria bacterium]|nr:50S ribosomal protein L17 [Candidatus Gottesmanbacteria bacterium]
MRHSYFGRKLSRTVNERRRLFMILARELIAHGQITTTLAKAKAVQPLVEKLITRAKKGSQRDKRLVFHVLADKSSTTSLMEYAKTRFGSRTSGFTRIVKLGPRVGDATEEAMLSFVDAPIVTGTVISETKKEIKPPTKLVKKPVAKKKK